MLSKVTPWDIIKGYEDIQVKDIAPRIQSFSEKL